MMAHKQMLHELLKEDQEPFQLKRYIADRRSQIKKSSPKTNLQIKRRIENPTKRSNLCKHACFLPFRNTHDVTKSPFIGFTPPAMSPCKSPTGAAVFLHVPSRTAAVLSEAAVRIEKQRRRKPKSQVKNVGFGLFGSFVKRLKDRNKNKKHVIGDNELKVLRNYEHKEKEKFDGDFRISCSCDLGASSSACKSEELDEINGDFTFRETRFCVSPFIFSLHKSASSSSGRRTPEFCSPAASPSRHVKQEKENNATGDLNKVQGEEEDKEQCSPVSVLDPFFEDEGRESPDAEEEEEEEEEDDYDLECSYANVQRAKEQLLYRLRRFEQLAELDPLELEKKLLEVSDDECQQESVESEDDDYKKQLLDAFVSCEDNHPGKLSADLIVEDKSKIICLKNKEVVCGRICNRLDLFKEIKFNTIDMMIELDSKRDCEGWKEFTNQVEETAADIEVAIFGLLVEELSKELFYNGERRYEL